MRRTRLDIISDILKVSKNGGAKKDHIIHRVGLNFEQGNSYLPLLEERGLLNREGNDGDVRYKTSKRGIDLLKEYEKFNVTCQNNKLFTW